MNGEQRREKIIDILNSSSKPVSGVALASLLLSLLIARFFSINSAGRSILSVRSVIDVTV